MFSPVAQGSTAIQVVPALAPHVAKLTTYVRGQTWLSPSFSLDIVQGLIGRPVTGVEENCGSCVAVWRSRILPDFRMLVSLRPEEIERFQADPEYFTRFRHTLEGTLNVSGLPVFGGVRAPFA